MEQHGTRIKLTFTEPLLGTLSGSPEIAKEFILTKYPGEGLAADETEALPDTAEELKQSSTLFARNKDGQPILWNYQIKGFFKDACAMLKRATGDFGKHSRLLKAHKKVIDGCIFVSPRQIPIQVDVSALTWTERPLRAQTAQGERIALARSETAPAGSSIEFEVALLDPKLFEQVHEWLDYGAMRGLGQWRNASYGSFCWELVEESVCVA